MHSHHIVYHLKFIKKKKKKDSYKIISNNVTETSCKLCQINIRALLSLMRNVEGCQNKIIINQIKRCTYLYLQGVLSTHSRTHRRNGIIEHKYTQRTRVWRSRALWFENPKPEFDSTPPPSRRGDVHHLTFLVPMCTRHPGRKTTVSKCNPNFCSKETVLIHKDIPKQSTITSFLRGIWFVNEHYKTQCWG